MKDYHKCKKNHSLNPSKYIFENGKYFKSVIDESIIMCYETINIASNIPTNVTSTVSINSDDEDVRNKMDYYILHTVLLGIMLLFLIAIICCHYANIYKQKRFEVLTI